VLSQETRYLEWYSDGVEGVDKFDGAKYGSFKLSEIILTSTQTSTSEITGALQVAGGVGVGGNLYVGGSGGIRTGKVEAISGYLDLQSYWDGSNNGQVRIIADDVDNNYGQITVSGAGIEFYTGTTSTDHSLTFGIDGTTTFSGKIIVQSTESSISTTTGALQVAGGVGIAENLNVGNSVYVNNAVNWLNSSTNVVAVYQVYNPDTQSLDTIFA
jgi:hypothetical protein